MKLEALLIYMVPPDAGYDAKEHPHIILTESFHDKVLIVNLTRTVRQSVDETCVLNVGDHPNIIKESFVLYKKADIIETKKILEGIKNKKIENKGILKKDTFQKVCKGLIESDKTKLKVKRFYKSYRDSLLLKPPH